MLFSMIQRAIPISHQNATSSLLECRWGNFRSITESSGGACVTHGCREWPHDEQEEHCWCFSAQQVLSPDLGGKLTSCVLHLVQQVLASSMTTICAAQIIKMTWCALALMVPMVQKPQVHDEVLCTSNQSYFWCCMN